MSDLPVFALRDQLGDEPFTYVHYSWMHSNALEDLPRLEAMQVYERQIVADETGQPLEECHSVVFTRDQLRAAFDKAMLEFRSNMFLSTDFEDSVPPNAGAVIAYTNTPKEPTVTATLNHDEQIEPGMCPVGCGRPAPDNTKVMCAVCWREVPQHIQREVYAAWRARKRLVGAGSVENYRKARDRHEAAKKAAIASVP